jgi:hypothetical protein
MLPTVWLMTAMLKAFLVDWVSLQRMTNKEGVRFQPPWLAQSIHTT